MKLQPFEAHLRRGRLIGADVLLIVVSFSLALPLRFVGAPPDLYIESLRDMLPAIVLFFVGANHAFGNYHRLWRYASAQEVMSIIFATMTGTLLTLAYDTLLGPFPHLPLSSVAFGGFFCLVAFTAVRYRRRLLRGGLARLRKFHDRGSAPMAKRQRVLIVGAGEAGQLLAWRLLNLEEGKGYEIVGFVDDDPDKQGMLVHGCKVLGDRRAILDIVARQAVDLIVLAMYNIDGENFRQILDICEMTPAVIKVLPNVFELLRSTAGLPPIRNVTTADLLGRKPVEIDRNACARVLAGKTVLVTGAAGSIGSELCRQVVEFGPARLIMVDNNESGLHDLFVSLEPLNPVPDSAGRVVPIVADVTNATKMWFVYERYKPQVVFHAAAYKHVPLMEEHPDEAVRVNVTGTRVVADLAVRHGAERFVLVSTDKAVNPSSVMGATKRLAELLTVLSGAGRSGTRCTAVRFGNVLGSRGSVVPIFERQIDRGGPVTVTHPQMTRYFISIPEAVSLVIQAAALTEGGDIFMLDMGQRINIDSLARRLIRLRGLRPEVDIPIVYTGVRPGEKMHEDLLGAGEERHPTSHSKIFRLCSRYTVERSAVERRVDELVALLASEHNGVVSARLREIVCLWRSEAPSEVARGAD